ncbi:MAG: ATP-binding protein [Gammaproteobacteria bacterium]|jgi:AAA15 family ATPase/GTPase
MLIEFNVSNFWSIYKRQTLSMVAGPGTELEKNVCITNLEPEFRLARAAVIYGPNAGGKSNLLNALAFMRMFILNSGTKFQHGDKIPTQSFSFNEASRHQPSEFEITFIKNKVRYQYGFTADTHRVFEEWLFAYPQGHAQKWFSRAYNNNDYTWKFSQKFFKGGKQLSELTPENVLFLSNAVKLNNKQLAPIFEWFLDDLLLRDPTISTAFYSKAFDSKATIDLLNTEMGKKKLLQLMKNAEPSCIDIKIDENAPVPKIYFIHTGNIPIELQYQSMGTRRLFAYAGDWINALDNGKILIIDELDSGLHPLMVRFLIELICNPKTNHKNAQLIFTTHDTSLLDNELLRRDQIWFVEKDKMNSTQLYSLLEFSPRKNEAIGKGYLQGRYGALPYIGEWKF